MSHFSTWKGDRVRRLASFFGGFGMAVAEGEGCLERGRSLRTASQQRARQIADAAQSRGHLLLAAFSLPPKAIRRMNLWFCLAFVTFRFGNIFLFRPSLYVKPARKLIINSISAP
jgi:hypothetical protein